MPSSSSARAATGSVFLSAAAALGQTFDALADQAGLPHAGVAADHDHAAAPAQRREQGVLEEGHLFVATDEDGLTMRDDATWLGAG